MQNLTLNQELIIAILASIPRKTISATQVNHLFDGYADLPQVERLNVCQAYPDFADALLRAYVGSSILSHLEGWPTTRSRRIVNVCLPILHKRKIEALTSPETWVRSLTEKDSADLKEPKASDLINTLWQQYSSLNFEASEIQKIFLDQGETIFNDHFALRTVNIHPVDIHNFISLFEQVGYNSPNKDYWFPDKKLYAVHLEHNDPTLPKVFISQLLLEECSSFVEQTMRDCIAYASRITSLEKLPFAGRLWPEVSYETYLKLQQESEYAAWLYVWGFMANHFTIKVNSLKNFTSIQSVNTLLEQSGYTINSVGGKVKGKPADLLQQSATLAQKIKVSFSEGDYEIPCCFYEFALRYNNSEGKEFSGFITDNADKIFESTNKR